MQDDEGDVGHAGLLEVLAAPVPVVQLLRPVLVGAFGNLNGGRKTKIFDPKSYRGASSHPSSKQGQLEADDEYFLMLL